MGTLPIFVNSLTCKEPYLKYHGSEQMLQQSQNSGIFDGCGTGGGMVVN